MALVWDGVPCAICGEPIADTSNDSDGDVFALTMWGITDPRFVGIDDAGMHQACIDNWHVRDEFLAYFNEHCSNELRVNRSGRVVYCSRWWPFS